MAGPSIDLTGQRFGRLVVIGHKGRNGYGRYLWECKCDCGNTHYVVSISLKNGHSQSCGCLLSERASEANRRHGGSGSDEHNVWCSMRHRCSDENATTYKYYGARGITVCERWANSFENFLADMGKRPPGTSIDRIDNDKGYSPDNCRWADRLTQQNNTRLNRWIEHDGRTMTLSQWARELGTTKGVLWARLKAHGSLVPRPKGRPRKLAF
jgi:hypothetical protein